MKVLTGQTVIISGGAGDIGAAIARQLARLGANIALADVRETDAVHALVTEITNLGRLARYDRVDISNPDEVRDWVLRVESEFGIVSLIIPNAAIVTLKDILAITPQEWERELQVNLNGAFYMAQAGAQRLVEHGVTGRIVFIGSWAAHAVHTNLPAYCVAKAGLRMLSKCMALDLASDGILVNEVAPGYVDAGLSGRIFDENPGKREKAAQSVPNNSLITADEVAMQVAHLCDPGNRHITGSVILMDGGLSLISPGSTRDA